MTTNQTTGAAGDPRELAWAKVTASFFTLSEPRAAAHAAKLRGYAAQGSPFALLAVCVASLAYSVTVRLVDQPPIVRIVEPPAAPRAAVAHREQRASPRTTPLPAAATPPPATAVGSAWPAAAMPPPPATAVESTRPRAIAPLSSATVFGGARPRIIAPPPSATAVDRALSHVVAPSPSATAVESARPHVVAAPRPAGAAAARVRDAETRSSAPAVQTVQPASELESQARATHETAQPNHEQAASAQTPSEQLAIARTPSDRAPSEHATSDRAMREQTASVEQPASTTRDSVSAASVDAKTATDTSESPAGAELAELPVPGWLLHAADLAERDANVARLPKPAVHAQPKLSAVAAVELLQVRGALPGSVVRRGLNRLLAQYGRCSELCSGAPQDCLHSSWQLRATIDESGHGRDAHVEGTQPQVQRCLERATASLVVQPPDTGIARVHSIVHFQANAAR